MKMGTKRILCGGHGTSRGSVLEVGMVKASLKGGPSDYRAEYERGKVDEVEEAVGIGRWWITF